MQLPKTYDPGSTENKWYDKWIEHKLFHSEPDSRPAYTIVIPPPNVTGVLHMGHMLNNTIQDILIRKARMSGFNACWVPGTDHASIATEAKVVSMLRDKGIEKKNLTREEFLEHAWEWNDKYGGIILKQLRKLGASCDWERTRFTMQPEMSAQVIKVFVDLYKKGHIYRGSRMVNWDPKSKTALSDEEVNYKEVQSNLYYIKYAIKGEKDQFITIATVRPETILGDTAICVHPDDERFKHLIGKNAIVPLVERPVPIIADEYVDPEFGTGALKITPAHDPNDYELGKKHNLETINILNEDATLNEAAKFFVGKDRFEARKMAAEELEKRGKLIKTENYTNKVGFSERTDAVVEPRLSMQWWCSMKEMAEPALAAVMEDDVKFFPEKFKNTYRHWMANIKDWCISRQLWWGQQIPAWYLPNGDFVVAENADEALLLAKEKFTKDITAADLRQDEDVLDTWFSSWLWPISVFNGITEPDNADINYYYPTQALVTAPEIIFFWVARMVMSGYEYRGKKPFSSVYFTGIVRDAEGRKMSKQLGNSPDPLDLIAQYGADAMRTGVLFSSPAGNDLLFDLELIEQGRNFCNKIWNALRLIQSWNTEEKLAEDEGLGEDKAAIEWFENRLNQVLQEVEGHFETYRMSDALMANYKLVWDDFCSNYLEMVKPQREGTITRGAFEKSVNFFERLMKMLHPFMPFITEEVYQSLKPRGPEDFITVAEWPKAKEVDEKLLQQAEKAFQLITQVRKVRNERNIPMKQELELMIKGEVPEAYRLFEKKITKLAGTSAIQNVSKSPEQALVFMVQSDEFYVPYGEAVDTEAEKEKLQKELQYLQGFLNSVEKKLTNERFVNNAPADVLERERSKKQDAEEKIKKISESLQRL